MPDLSQDNLLARLAGHGDPSSADNPWATLAATEPEPACPGAPVESAAAAPPKAPSDEKKLDELLGRVKQLVGDKPAAAAPAAAPLNQDAFIPLEPA